MQTEYVDVELKFKILVGQFQIDSERKMVCSDFALYVNPLQHCLL